GWRVEFVVGPRRLVGERDASAPRGSLDRRQRLLLRAQDLRRAELRRGADARRAPSTGASRAPRAVDPSSVLHATRRELIASAECPGITCLVRRISRASRARTASPLR